MDDSASPLSDVVSRRRVLAAGGSTLATVLVGCSSGSDNQAAGTPTDSSTSETSTTEEKNSPTESANPKQVAKEMVLAMRNDDEEKIRALLHPDSPISSAGRVTGYVQPKVKIETVSIVSRSTTQARVVVTTGTGERIEIKLRKHKRRWRVFGLPKMI